MQQEGGEEVCISIFFLQNRQQHSHFPSRLKIKNKSESNKRAPCHDDGNGGVVAGGKITTPLTIEEQDEIRFHPVLQTH